MGKLVYSNCGGYTWDGRNVRTRDGALTLLPWTWVAYMGTGWAEQ